MSSASGEKESQCRRRDGRKLANDREPIKAQVNRTLSAAYRHGCRPIHDAEHLGGARHVL